MLIKINLSVTVRFLHRRSRAAVVRVALLVNTRPPVRPHSASARCRARRERRPRGPHGARLPSARPRLRVVSLATLSSRLPVDAGSIPTLDAKVAARGAAHGPHRPVAPEWARLLRKKLFNHIVRFVK